MKHLLIFFGLIVLMASCWQVVDKASNDFEKNYYENITGIKFPDKYKLVATADNGEFMTTTILDLERADCKKFITENNFQSIAGNLPPRLNGFGNLDSSLRQLPNRNKLLRNWGRKGKNDWTYLLDTTTCRLYCEISYPDWAGN